MRPQRNAPCPCGSGKKYKRCCAKDPVQPIQVSEHDRASALRRLVLYAEDEGLMEVFERARTLVWERWEPLLPGVLVESLNELQEPHSMICGLATLTLPLAGEGCTLIARMLDDPGVGLTAGQSQALEELSRSRLETLVVCERAGGGGYQLQREGGDFLTQELGKLTLKPGSRLLARVAGTRDARIPSGYEFLLQRPPVADEPELELPGSRERQEHPGPDLFDRWLHRGLAGLVFMLEATDYRVGSWEGSYRVRDLERLRQFFAGGVLDVLPLPDSCWLWHIPELGAHPQGLIVASGKELLATACDRQAGRWLRKLLEVHGAKHLETTPPPRDYRPGELYGTSYPYHYAHLGDYLDADELTRSVPKEARRMALYLGRIVARTTAGEPGRRSQLGLACRRRPWNLLCSGVLRASYFDEGAVEWDCPACGDAGRISSWQDTPFDRRARAEPGAEDSGVLVTYLNESDLARLLRLVHLPVLALRALASATSIHEDSDQAQLEGTRAELLSLQRAIPVHLEFAESVSKVERKSLVASHALLADCTGAACDLSSAAAAAELLLFERARKRARRPHALPAGTHRLRVELLDVEPRVLRVIELASNATLHDLHQALVLAFERDDRHLHAFELDGGRQVGEPSVYDVHPLEDERGPSLRAALPRVGAHAIWEYDFGDSWRHRIEVEALTAEAPARARVVQAERAAPPEDCGGPPGYADLLSAWEEPRHERQERVEELMRSGFDPEHCDLEQLDGRVGRL